MSFLLTCPGCGPREVHEFLYGGQISPPGPPGERPAGSNLPGVQTERWYHRLGCRRWLMAERDVRTNEIRQTRWLEGEG